jgi:3-deoxy-manno-octulosonate cytidylyltransferase (CMP-KDO synthetase)
MQRAVAIIPARYNSTRFAGKALALLKEKPLIQHVYENVKHASLIDSVLVATDDERIYNTVEDFGGRAVMTSAAHPSGTDRIAEAARDIECDFVVNIQGDEPFIMPQMVDDVVTLLSGDERASIGTLAKRISDVEEVLSPDVVKVVLDSEGFALYFSRSPIPYVRDEWRLFPSEAGTPDEGSISFELRPSEDSQKRHHFFKHIGIYGYRRESLMRFSTLGSTMLEITERLEQLRALVCGMRIKVKETDFDTLGIDTPDDLRKGEEWLNTYS